MTSKQALDWLKKQNKKQNNGNGDLWLEMYIDAIEKDLEVLEIIKNKLVFPLALMSLPYELYNQSVNKEQQLTQEEYDKIKEWLKNEK